MMRTATRCARALAVALLVLAIAGCFNPFNPRVGQKRGVSEPMPLPDSPRSLLLLFKWCWEHENIDPYRELFTEDFRFGFAATDTAGNRFLDRGWTREDEIEGTRHLFEGIEEKGLPRANRITLDFDRDLIAFPDSRPGKTDPWHKEIFTQVNILYETTSSTDRAIRSVRFFVVRGDSAAIPQELRDLGFGADPNRWYIERYEEQDLQGSALSRGGVGMLASRGSGVGMLASRTSASSRAGAAPEESGSRLGCATWGCIKSRYR
jgi:hypothetical protein